MSGMKILCVFNDAAFAERGFAALKKTSYLVYQAATLIEAERDFTLDSFQLVVIGPGLTLREKEELAVKAWEFGCSVIVACANADDYKIMADAHLEPNYTESQMINAAIKAITAKFYVVAA